MKINFDKQHLDRRIISFGAIFTCLIFLFLLNVVFYLLAQNNSSLGFDLTKDKLFKLSPDTVDFLKTLKKKVTIYVLAREETFTETSPYNVQANQVFKQFELNGPSISLVYVDYVRNPGFTAAYPDLTIKHGDILVQCETAGGTRHTLVKTEELFNYTEGQQGNYSIASSRAEEAIYTAILNVTSEKPLRVAVINGHGEYAISAFTGILQKNNYEINQVNLLISPIDSSFDLAFVIAPKDDFSEAELNRLDQFLFNGGKYGKTLLYCASSEQPPLSNIAVFLSEWGIVVGDGVVFETDEHRVYNYQPFYTIADYTDEEFSSFMRINEKLMLVPASRPLTKIFDYRNNYSTKVLLEFASSTGVRPFDAPPDFTSSDAIVRGPIPALILCKYSLINHGTGKADAQSNMVISGSAAMLDAFAVENPGFSNTEYLVNLLNQLSARVDIIPLRPKSFTSMGLNLPRLTINIIGLLFIAVTPLIILVIGFTVWIKRKHS